MIYIRKREKS